MKILHVITSFYPGGAEKHLYALTKSQVEMNNEVFLISLKPKGISDDWEAINAKIYFISIHSYFSLKAIFKLRKLFNKINPDIIHSHLPPAELFTFLTLLTIKKNFPLVISKHNDEPFYKFPKSSLIGKLVSNRASKLIAISKYCKEYTINSLKIKSDKIEQIYYGIDTSIFNVSCDKNKKILDEFNIDSNEYIIGTISRLVPQKDLVTLLKAFHYFINNNIEVRSKLIIVGEGFLENKLKKLVIDLKIEDKIIWTGYRSDSKDLLSIFDVFSLTSIYEGFGLVLIEAMSAKKPIVATRASAIDEIVIDGVTGIKCDIGDFKSIGDAFTTLKDSEIRSKFGSAGYERSKNDFTVSKMCIKTLEVYNAIINKM